MDTAVARATWDVFTPSFGLTAESLVFGSAAGILIWLAFLFVWYIFDRGVRILTAR